MASISSLTPPPSPSLLMDNKPPPPFFSPLLLPHLNYPAFLAAHQARLQFRAGEGGSAFSPVANHSPPSSPPSPPQEDDKSRLHSLLAASSSASSPAAVNGVRASGGQHAAHAVGPRDRRLGRGTSVRDLAMPGC